MADALSTYPNDAGVEKRHANLTTSGRVGSIAETSITGTTLWSYTDKAKFFGPCFEDACLLEGKQQILKVKWQGGETILVSQEKEPCSRRCKSLYLCFAKKYERTVLVHYHRNWEADSPTPGCIMFTPNGEAKFCAVPGAVRPVPPESSPADQMIMYVTI